MTKKNKDDNVILRESIRWKTVEEAQKWEEYITVQTIKHKIKKSEFIRRVLMEKIDNDINGELLSSFKNDIFLAFKKAIFASTKAMHNKLDLILYVNKEENKIINDKLNFLLNTAIQKIDINTVDTDLLKNNFIAEWNHFESLKETLNKKLNDLNKTNTVVANQTQKAFNDFWNSDLSANVLDMNIAYGKYEEHSEKNKELENNKL